VTALRHPLHPILAIFPLSLLAASIGMDAMAFATRDPSWLPAARWALGTGALTGIVVAIPGIVDLRAYPPAARGVPVRHAIFSSVAMGLMAAGWFLRGSDGSTPRGIWALSLVAAAVAIIGRRVAARLTASPTASKAS
jgi:uncharacterized membrane protein